MRRLAIAIVLMPFPVQAAPEWAGYWAAEPGWCANAARVGSVTPAPIYLAETEMLGYENSCDVIYAEPGPMAHSWVMGLECHAEGSAYEEEQMLFLSGDGAVLHIWSGALMTRFERCKP